MSCEIAPENPPAPRRRWIAFVSVALAALIAGAGAATSVLLLAGWSKPAEQRYGAAFFLDEEITEAQRNALQAELEKIPGARDLRYESSEQAYARFKETYQNDPELIERVEKSGTQDSLPASYRLTVSASDFRCETMRTAAALPGVKQYSALVEPINQIPSFAVRCNW